MTGKEEEMTRSDRCIQVRRPVKMDTGTGKMLPQTKECQKPPGAGKGKEVCPRDFRGNVALSTP